MKTTLILGALAAALATAAPAWADHNRLVAPADAERNANAESAEPEGSTTDFTMNVELDEWLRRAARWWSRGLTDL